MAQTADTSLKCYICDQPIIDDATDIHQTCTENTKTLINELLEQFIGHNLSRPGEKSYCCCDCLSRINDYDLACYTAHQVQKELTELLTSTNAKYCHKAAVASVDDEDESDDENGCGSNKEDLLSGSYVDVDVIDEDDVDEEEQDSETSFPLKQAPRIAPAIKREMIVEELDDETDEFELRFFSAPETLVKYEELYDNAVEDAEQYEYTVYENSISQPGDVATSSTRGPAATAEFSEQRAPPNYCLQCERNFETKDLLREHRRTIHKKPPKLHTCEVCGVVFKLRNALRVHMLMHTGISPFQCDVCGKKFTQKGALKRHMPIHTGECRYQCDKCGKQFIHYSSFHMHNLAHDDVRKKKCEVCGLLLRSNSHLKRHLQVHTGAKPHKCPKCEKTFAQRYNMMTHLRSHQGLPRKRKHTCPVCERVFTKETSLQDHLNTGICRSDDTSILDLYSTITTNES